MFCLLRKIKEILKNKNPKIYSFLIKIKSFFKVYYIRSYSQFGEDIVLASFIKDYKTKKGFFIDVGAYHPKKYSNTYLFYRQGWNGINIDAKPGSMNKFKKTRKRDINLELAVSNDCEKKLFYIYNESVYNTFDYSMVEKLNKKGIIPNKKIEIKSDYLENILNNFLSVNKKIDFLSIDVEGYDFKVLKSNNWGKYKPKFILIEIHDFNFNHLNDYEVVKFLKKINYKLVAVTKLTLIFVHEK